MFIAGLQKMSLVDFPGKVACTVFTGGCNLRCPYCHNSELLSSPPRLMTEEEFLHFLKKREGLLDAVVVTGGEPCLQKDLPDFLGKIRRMPFAVKLDTNGLFPSVLEAILANALADYVAMDLKNSPDRFSETVGIVNNAMVPGSRLGEAAAKAGLDDAQDGGCGEAVGLSRNVALSEGYARSLSLLLASGIPFELRTTVVEQLHDASSFEGIRDYLLPLTEKAGKKIPAYYLQSFSDRETVPYAGFSAPSRKALEAYAQILAPVAETVALRGV